MEETDFWVKKAGIDKLSGSYGDFGIVKLYIWLFDFEKKSVDRLVSPERNLVIDRAVARSSLLTELIVKAGLPHNFSYY